VSVRKKKKAREDEEAQAQEEKEEDEAQEKIIRASNVMFLYPSTQFNIRET